MCEVGRGTDRHNHGDEDEAKGIEPELSGGGIEGAAKIEEQTGIGPLFEPVEAGYQHADAAEYLGPANEWNEVLGVAKAKDKLYGFGLHDDIAYGGENHKAGKKDGGDPIDDLC